MRKRHLLLPLLSAIMVTPCFGEKLQMRMESTTIFRSFEDDESTRFQGDGKKRGFTVDEFLRAEVGKLSSDGLSLHVYGRAGYDFSEDVSDRASGQLFYGYLQYANQTNNILVRAGRQYIFQGVSNESFDGLRIDADVTPFFTLSGYGGQPLAVEEIEGRKGDSIWGGRFAHRVLGLYDVGLSYKRVANDGDEERKVLGVDVSFTPPGPVTLFGSSTRNLVTNAWAEHSYQARVILGGFTIEPMVQHFDYDAYFEAGVYTKPPFSHRIFSGLDAFLGSGEKLNVVGGTVSWLAGKGVEVGAKVKRYDYSLRDDKAWYYAGLATVRGPWSSKVGAELGRMQGDADEDRYTLARAFWSADPKFLYLFGDVVYAAYDEDIYGKSYSLSASASVGKKLSKALSLEVRGDYSSDPYFDSDLRGFLTVNYVFEM